MRYPQEAHGIGGFTRPHRKTVSNRQDGDMGTVKFANQAHIPEQGCIPRKIDA